MEIKVQNVKNIIDRGELVYEKLFSYFSSLEKFTICNYRLPAGYNFYRGRKNERFENFKKITDLYAPPFKVVKNYSRANIPFQSMLYVSDMPETNLAELKLFLSTPLDIGDIIEVTQVQFEQIEDLKIVIVPDSQNARMSKLVKGFTSGLPENQIVFWNYINHFFRKPINPINDNTKTYQVTSAFCNAMWAESCRNKKDLDGILYTSVEYTSGFNLVLAPDLIQKNKIVARRVFKTCLKKTAEQELTQIGIIPSTSIDLVKNQIKWE